MSDLNETKISSASFSPENFVKDLTKPSVGVEGLQVARLKVQSLADETNSLLKKNVYKNYSLFIDTAKEISYLKSEMYQLSHLLNEQQTLLSSLQDISISGDKGHGLTASERKEVVEKGKLNRFGSDSMSSDIPKSHSIHSIMPSAAASSFKELNAIFDRIEGCSGVLDARSRSLIYSGELTELDSNDYRSLPGQGPLMGVLLNDCFVLASSVNRAAMSLNKKYKFFALYELDNIAVVNVKDPNFRTAFKILMFPQTKVFKVDSIEVKNKWLEFFDLAKKHRKASLTLQRRDSLMFMSNLSTDGGGSVGGKGAMSPIDRPYSSILTSFEEADLLEEVVEADTEVLPMWLIESPEDLDVCIAQRNFEDAVILVHKVNDHFALYPKCCDNAMQNDLKLRIDHKIKELIDTIANELQLSPDRSLQSGPRSARRAVHLLLKLGKSSMATKLFLAQRSALLKFCLKQQKMDGGTVQYIKRISSVFFTNLSETCKEFQKAFDVSAATNGDTVSMNSDRMTPGGVLVSPAVLACLVSWSKKQAQHFLSLFSRTVFTGQTSATVASESVACIRSRCNKLKNNTNLDIIYYMDKKLRSDIEQIIAESRDKLLEAVKLRGIEDNWQPHNYSNKTGINKFLEEMSECGLNSVQNYVYDENGVSLTVNTTSFSKSYVILLHDLLKLSTSFTHKYVIEALIAPFKAQLRHIDKSLKAEQFKGDAKFIRRNAVFILDTLLALAEQYYSEKIGTPCKEFAKLFNDYSYLKSEEGHHQRKKRSPSKTALNPLEDVKINATTYL